jgi:hypothetical protein
MMRSPMRTTITLDTDTEALLRRRMRQTGSSFKQVVNDAIRAGLTSPGAPSREVSFPTYAMGVPTVDLDRALALAGALEDEELVRRMRVGK